MPAGEEEIVDVDAFGETGDKGSFIAVAAGLAGLHGAAFGRGEPAAGDGAGDGLAHGAAVVEHRRGSLGLELGLVVHVLEQVDARTLVVDLRVVQDEGQRNPLAYHEQARHRDQRKRDTFGQEKAEVEH